MNRLAHRSGSALKSAPVGVPIEVVDVQGGTMTVTLADGAVVEMSLCIPRAIRQGDRDANGNPGYTVDIRVERFTCIRGPVDA